MPATRGDQGASRYHAVAVARLAGVLLERGWLAPDALIVAERATRDPAPDWPDALATTWSRRYGETTLHFATQEDA